MPRRNDITSIFVIGAGPIIIGQACEFDYSGTQACKALKEEGYRVILVNSNPATIMTDPSIVDATYIEPITLEIIEKIIEKEKPDAVLPTVGGQTALNMGILLETSGILKKHNMIMLGATADVIQKAESRELFNQAMHRIGLEVPHNKVVKKISDAKKFIKKIGLPAVIRPSLTLGGTGGGIAYTMKDFEKLVAYGLSMSPIHEILIDESLVGWKEFEMEVVRDTKDNAIIICSIENIDPMGVHTGDSITVAPALTLTDKEYQRMRDASIAILREIGVETGGSNVQFAIHPTTGKMVVIEMNPRVSRSSALASKVTGFPIAKIAAKLAVGYTLDELQNDITKTTPASFEPAIDYVVIKIPRFDFEKFGLYNTELSTSMKSVGEIMAIGRSFAEALQKGFCSLEIGLNGLNEQAIPLATGKETKKQKLALLKKSLTKQYDNKLLLIADAIRAGISIKEIIQLSKFDPWFVKQIESIVIIEKQLKRSGVPKTKADLFLIKSMGFSDSRIAFLTKKDPQKIYELRKKYDIYPIYKKVDTCAAEFQSFTSYLYSTYEFTNYYGNDNIKKLQCESNPSNREKVIIIGGGPNRIGQGIEFDYTCVHSVYTLRKKGIETIMLNCNPETVSTDYDTADKLYFEPLYFEHVLEICRIEIKNGKLMGVIVQNGGQTPLKLAKYLVANHIPILGTSFNDIDLAENRDKFRNLLYKLQLSQAPNNVQYKVKDIAKGIKEIGYPVVIRPSNVLGGRAMAILYNDEEFNTYIRYNESLLLDGPILIDKFLDNAKELDVDIIRDAQGNIYIAGIMEHVEKAGIHSGDSACCIPSDTFSPFLLQQVILTSKKIANALNIIGFLNIQYAIKNEQLFVIEANSRASRTVPFISKATATNVVKWATLAMIGDSIGDRLQERHLLFYAFKECVFPFARFNNVDTLLGPEMKSTGEVMGIDKNIYLAFAKSQMAAYNFPTNTIKNILLCASSADSIIPILPAIKLLLSFGCIIWALSELSNTLSSFPIHYFSIDSTKEKKIPSFKELSIQFDFAIMIAEQSFNTFVMATRDIRYQILYNRTPCCTTVDATVLMVHAIIERNKNELTVSSLQELYVVK